MPKQQQKAKAKGRKIGRAARKVKARGNAIALFVRNKISAAQYFEMTGQKIKN